MPRPGSRVTERNSGLLPLLVAFRASDNTFSPPIWMAAGEAVCTAGCAGVAGCCRQPAASITDVARRLPKHCFPFCKSSPFCSPPLARARPKKQKSSYPVFAQGRTIGHELNTQTEPRRRSRSACSQSGSASSPTQSARSVQSGPHPMSTLHPAQKILRRNRHQQASRLPGLGLLGQAGSIVR